MINIQRVAFEIKTIGLYDLVLQDVQRLSKKNKPTEDDIIAAMQQYPEILRDYMQTNVEYNLSNIHIKEINLDTLMQECRADAQKVNNNLKRLHELEKYTLDFEQSATLVIIFSIEFFVLFSVQYFIVLLNLKEWQWWIYGLFASSVLIAWAYARKQGKLYKKNKEIYDATYIETLKMLDKLEEKGCIEKKQLLIAECDEHV